MKLLVYSFKGGVGKTSIGLSYALEKGYGVVTNDVYSPLEKLLPKEYLLKIPPDAELPTFPKEYNLVFDFGGYIDKRVIGAAEQADYVVIPTVATHLELQVTLETIKEVESHNSNIVVVANKIGKGDYENIKAVIAKFFDYPVYPLKQSKIFSKLFESKNIKEKRTLREIAEENPLSKHVYKDVVKQFNALTKVLK